MNCGLVSTSLVVLLAAVARVSPADELASRDADSQSVTIPLDQIWALNMPGTLDVQELDKASADRPSHKLINKIRNELQYIPRTSADVARQGFVVAGGAEDALDEVYAVLSGNRKARQSLLPNRDIWLVFFSLRYGQYVQLTKVKRRGNRIEILYRLVPHRANEVTSHFAMIPLGNLPTGEYHVEISPAASQIGTTSDSATLGKSRRLVCQSFTFSIDPRPPGE
jgi:hypothetical protein